MEYQDEPKREFKGIWIPAEIWLDTDLSITEKILYAEVNSFTSNDKACYISNKHISELLGVSETNASKTLNSLIKKGYIISEKFDGRKRYVRTLQNQQLRFDTDDNAGLSQMTRQSCHERQDTNIYTNTNDNLFTSTNVDVPLSENLDVSVQKPKKSTRKKKYTEEQTKLHNDCKDFFLDFYLKSFGEDFYWLPKDAAAVVRILNQIKTKMPDDEKENNEQLLFNFQAFITKTFNTADNFTKERFNLPLISSNFNTIYLKIKNGKQRNHQNARDDEQSFLDALERRYGSDPS